MGSASYLQAIRPDTGAIRKLIENSLLHDWIIRIEINGGKSEYACWKQWGETFFALRSAESVIAVLTSCYAKYSDHAIRINAEKVRPQTRMFFTAYNPHYLVTTTNQKSQVSGWHHIETDRQASSHTYPAIVE